MKIPLSCYGLVEWTVLPALLAGLAGLCWYIWPAARPVPQATAAVLIMMVLAFFRDPQRRPAVDGLAAAGSAVEGGVLWAPADGKVTDIVTVEEDEFIKGSAWRIGIFLRIYDVHINRSPCAGRVEYIRAQPGKCINAGRYEAASAQNRANCLGLSCPGQPAGKIMVKQITGAIARRIVCACKVGDTLTAGERFGMIKFGSRTELYLPREERARILVHKGDKVQAGLTALVRYEEGRTKIEHG